MPALRPAIQRAALLGEISARWRAADPLLPAARPCEPGAGCGAVFAWPARRVSRRPSARASTGTARPESLELTWGAARRFRLEARSRRRGRCGRPRRTARLWRVHLAGVPGADDPDSAAIVTWPSRDIDGIAYPAAPRVRAARRRRRAAQPAAGTAMPPAIDRAEQRETPPLGVGVRRAGQADLDTVVRLGLEVIRYDAHFGGVVERAEHGGGAARRGSRDAGRAPSRGPG